MLGFRMPAFPFEELIMKLSILPVVALLCLQVALLQAAPTQTDSETKQTKTDMNESQEEKITQAIYRICDKDENGKLSEVELDKGIGTIEKLINNLNKTFEMLDEDGDGEIDEKEREKLKEIKAAKEGEMLNAIIGLNEGGKISKPELENGIKGLEAMLVDLKGRIGKADKDGDKMISKNELKQQMDEEKNRLQNFVLKAVMSNFHETEDGKISEHELETVIQYIIFIMKNFEKNFEMIDENNDNAIDFNEMSLKLKEINGMTLEDMLGEIFSSVFAKGDQKVSIDVLKEALNNFKEMLIKIKEKFNELDTDGDNMIDQKELAAFFEKKKALDFFLNLQ